MLLTREQLQERLIALHKASLELVKDVSLEHLLYRIAATACEQANAQYAALGVPIRAGDQQLGQIYLTNKVDAPEFTADDERIIQMLAAYAAAAIQNALLHENSQRMAALEERERIGMDLHDGIIQSIYGLGLSLESAFHALDENPSEAKDRFRHVMDGLNQVIRDIRSYILDLRPRKMGDEGLAAGLKRLATEFRANTLAEIAFTSAESDINGLPESHAMALFHICQEALANVAKHAQAKNVQLLLWTTEDRALMEINDDGNGFDTEKINTSIGHGLANMQTRAHSVGGEVDISSVLNEGSTILAWVPRRAQV